MGERDRTATRDRDGDLRRWRLELDGGEALDADAVLVATPAPEAARLVAPIDRGLGELLGGIPYASAATVSLAFRRADVPHPLDAFGFVVPAVERRKIVACTFVSVKYSGRAPEGSVLLRGFVGGALAPAMFALDEPSMIAAVLEELRGLLGIGVAPLFARVARWPESMPQYLVGHVGRVTEIERLSAAIDGFALAGNAYHGVGLADCVRSGEAAADALIDSLTRAGPASVVARQRSAAAREALPARSAAR